MLLAALFCVTRIQEIGSIDLSRGAPLANQQIGYWDVTDTYLDSQSPDQNFGGEGVLLGGPGRTILIKFGDLERVLGRGKIVSASIVLTPSGGDVPELRSAARLNDSWGEGPVNTISSLMAKPTGPAGTKPVASRWSATWKSRHAGEDDQSWQSAGATGPGDTTSIADAKMVAGEREIEISGLGPAVQQMLDHPVENGGFALTFANASEFFSSQSPFGRPKLKITWEAAAVTKGPDLSIVAIERSGAAGALPKVGEDATYTAHIKNVGDQPTTGFSSQWVIGGRKGSTIESVTPLAPGEETTLITHRPYKFDPTDHRLQPIALKITPKGPDASTANDMLEVQENARLIEVSGPAGSEDRVQQHVRFFNEVIAPQSRFSFAREGVLERIAVQRYLVGPSNINDGVPKIEAKFGASYGIDLEFIRTMLKAVGLPDLSNTNYPAGVRNTLANRGSEDIASGLMGYGDTRFDGSILGTLPLVYEPYPSPVFDTQPLEKTGLLSETDVAVLNQTLSGQKKAADVLNRVPKTVLIKALDLIGRPLPQMELSFFQSSKGELHEDPPAFTVVTSTTGTAILPVKETGPFGTADLDGGNGVFLIRASSNGVTEWGWLKNWQLVDSFSRSGTDATLVEVRFNLPGAPLDTKVDLATDRIITDSAESLPASLSNLLDGKYATPVVIPGKGGWVQVDLGRDRTLGEIDLIGESDKMWPKFDIQVLATGQSASQPTVWAKEMNWNWVSRNRRDLLNGQPLVAYRGAPVRVRYVRIVNRSDSAGSLRGIRIIPSAN